MTELNITRETTSRGERYVAIVDGHECVLTFTDTPDGKRITDYTGVPKALGGRHIGTKLVRRAVEDARAERKTIVPTCWFVKLQIDRHKDWQDVLG